MHKSLSLYIYIDIRSCIQRLPSRAGRFIQVFFLLVSFVVLFLFRTISLCFDFTFSTLFHFSQFTQGSASGRV